MQFSNTVFMHHDNHNHFFIPVILLLSFCVFNYCFSQIVQEIDQSDFQMNVELLFSDSDYG